MLILASASPRRQELLTLITTDFTIKIADVDETLDELLEPSKAVEYLAFRKARAVSTANPKDLVIGADTIVTIDDNILGKPKNSRDAKYMLEQLSGRCHKVYTGVALLGGDSSVVFSVCTQVAFQAINEKEMTEYIATKEPFDKAGGYGIQGYGAKFIKGIKGDYFNVVGLPVNRLYNELRKIKYL